MTAISGPLFTWPVPGSIWTASKCCLMQVGRPFSCAAQGECVLILPALLGAGVLVFIPAWLKAGVS